MQCSLSNRAISRPQRTHSLSRLASAVLLPAVFALVAAPLHAVSCTTPSALQPADRDALLTTGTSIAGAVAAQNFDLLQASLLPTVSGDWDSIRGVAQSAAPVTKGGTLHWGDAYLLDATDLKEPSDTQFFCSLSDSSVTITIVLRSLPAGRYALLIGDYEGTPLAGQIGLILGTDPTAGGKWKLGGLFLREGAFEGHDGVWYWSHARELAAQKKPWSAWFSYDAARWLLIPVDFLSSPHLEKLNHEQAQLGANPADSLPLTVTGSGTYATSLWKITSVRLNTSLHTADLGLTYESTGVTDPAAARGEAIAVMSAFLKQHPEIRENFHGLWAFAEKDGRRTFAIEQAMHDIP